MPIKSSSVIEVNDPKWSEIVSSSYVYDFYHTQSYHQLELIYRPVLFVANFEKDFIAIPFLIRSIEDTPYFDCTSVYGYPGPISNIDFKNISNTHIDYFQEELLRFFKNNKIITAFSRLHPLFSNHVVLKNLGQLIGLNDTVVIDTSITEDDQKKKYRKSIKYEINQLRKKDVIVYEAESREDINEFISIYKSTMKKVAATEDYFYNEDYFNRFLNSPCFEKIILLAKHKEKIYSGAIFTISNGIMQYHLSGALDFEGKHSLTKLIIDEARILATKLKLKFLHLGGGFGGSDKDSLFHFKLGFSDIRRQFRNWNFVVDQNIYNQLNKKVTILENGSNFFPLYRSIKNSKPKVYIFGCSGHAKVIIDILLLMNDEIISILDDKPIYSELLGFPVFDYNNVEFLNPDNQLIVAVGLNGIRKEISKRWKGKYKIAIHPKAIVSSFSTIEDGTVVMASAIINSGARIGKHVIINSGALIEHDCIIKDFAHISPMASLAGNVMVGEGTQIGINATIRQGIYIGKWATIGAGAVIVKDVPDFAVVVGNPGKIIKYNQ
jgi:sugar O-acyltransferase (sialic acid O-acetyltransferase NeuD family)